MARVWRFFPGWEFTGAGRDGMGGIRDTPLWLLFVCCVLTPRGPMCGYSQIFTDGQRRAALNGSWCEIPKILWAMSRRVWLVGLVGLAVNLTSRPFGPRLHAGQQRRL